jgi:predicted transcriptional regulator
MRKRLIDLLRLAGLREEEAILYLHLLKLRRASMSELIACSELNVMTAYRTMKRLQERGLVSATKINQKQSVYAPLTLSALTAKLDVEQRKLRKLQLALENLDPLLPYLDATDDHMKEMEKEWIELREGREAFREEYLKIPMMCADEFLHIGSMQNYWRTAGMTDESPEELSFRHYRIQHGISARIFNTYSPESVKFHSRDSREMRTTRLLDDLPITKNYLAFTASDARYFFCDEENPRVIIIRQPELVALHKKQFQQLWEGGTGA